jgi:hypothetical protein
MKTAEFYTQDCEFLYEMNAYQLLHISLFHVEVTRIYEFINFFINAQGKWQEMKKS